MRLLCTTNLEILDVPDDAVPPYAVLSHTWGKDEVSYQDLRALCDGAPERQNHRQQDIIKGKPGFAKVRDSAALAHSRGLSRIWIDTCCIDKTSSAELSEAINSMYRWYQEAQECYAFLSDVERVDGNGDSQRHLQGNGEDEEMNVDPDKIAKGFSGSRWFTRGWTLQELIAPQKVFFYDMNWSYLGSKAGSKNMPVVLSRITGVDRGVLAGHMQPSDLSVASRMQWAADRRTTRTEDLAYCLIGVFDVNMPLLYGEGTKAFTRLQEEILRVTDDQSIFAWAVPDDSANGSPEDICGLLATHPRQFKDIRSMNPLPPLLGRASVPSSFTNQGLRVQLQLRPVVEVEGINAAEAVPEEYIAILDCSVTTGVSHFWPALHLQRLWNDQFARIRPSICRYLPAPVVAGSELQVIYVKQKPKHVIPELFVPMSSISHDSMFMDLEDVHPTTRWNPHSMTLKSVYSSGNGAMGVFRFAQKGNSEDKVDVVVGIRPSEFQLKTRQVAWEAWCFQRRWDGRTLREVFEIWDKALLKSGTSRPSLVDYQFLYGEDHRLLSSAYVIETMMYGRLFFSVQVSKRQELADHADLASSDSSIFSDDGHTIQGPSLEELASEITAPCFTTTFYGEERARLKNGVRTRERYNSNWLPLVSGLKAHPTMGADPPQAKRKTGDWVRFTRSLASGSISMEPWNSKLLDACRRGDHEKVKELLRRGASVNCCTRNTQFNPWGFTMEGLTPLHWAIITKSESIIAELMYEGANIMAASTDGWNALHFLALHYDSDEYLPEAIAEKLEAMPEHELAVLAGTKVSDMLETPLHILCGRTDGNKALFNIMFNNDLGLRRSKNAQGELPLHRAAAAGNLHAVTCYANTMAGEGILDAQDEQLRTPVWHASGSSYYPSNNGKSAKNGNNGNKPSKSPSQTGTSEPQTLTRLLAVGANPNLSDNLGRTPLHIACREGRPEAVRVLLEQGGAYAASPSAYLSMTPYHFAALFQSERCLQVLLEKRPPELREFDQLTTTSSTTSSSPGHTDGMSVARFTPLHLAAANGWYAGASMLVAAGADLETGCSHYMRLGREEGKTKLSSTNMVGATAVRTETYSPGQYSPKLVEMEAASAYELVDKILESKRYVELEEPGLLRVHMLLERLTKEKRELRRQQDQAQGVERQHKPDSATTGPGTAAGTTMYSAMAMITAAMEVGDEGNRSRKHTIEGQQSLLSSQREDVVDLSSYDGGLALDLPTPGLSPGRNMEFGDFVSASAAVETAVAMGKGKGKEDRKM